jgi:hypothetical protein
MSNLKSAGAFASEQVFYASVIESLRDARLPDGRSLSEALTLGEVSFFDVFSAEMAWRHITTAKAANTLSAKMKLRVKPAVLMFRQFLADRRVKRCPIVVWPEEPFVICLAFTERMYRDVLEPVVQKIVREDGMGVVVLSQKLLKDAPKTLGFGVSNVSTDCFWNEEIAAIHKDLRAALKVLPGRRDIWYAIRNCMSFDRLKKNDEFLSSQILDAIGLVVDCYIPLMLRQAAIGTYIIATKQPCVVLSPDISDSRTRIYSFLCRNYGIPSINIQFGLTGDEAVEWRNYPGDRVAVWGENSRKALLRHGVPSSRITVTGSPRYEYLETVGSGVIDSFRKKLKIDSGCPVVLFASTYYDPTHSAYVSPNALTEMKKSIFAAASNNPNVLMIVKPHPVEDVAELQAFAGLASNIVVVDRDCDGREFIPSSDIFISFGSTMTIDALLAEKPCVCPVFPGWPFSESFISTGAVLAPQSPLEIAEIFSTISTLGKYPISNQMIAARKKFLTSTVCVDKTASSVRIREIMLEMIDRQSHLNQT